MTHSPHAAIDSVLQDAVRDGALPHAVGMAADRDGIIYQGVAGPRAAGGDSGPVAVDSIFRIASMTKLVVTVVALQLAQEGKLDLTSPVADHLPAFAELPVLEAVRDGVPQLRAAAEPARVHQLLSHTSGVAYADWDPTLKAWEQLTDAPTALSGVRRFLDVPLVADPGTRFAYGPSTDWLGLVVEAIEGRGLDEVVARRITGPLDMPDTTFVAAETDPDRLVAIHLRDADGGWVPAPFDLPPEPEYFSGGLGLYSTPRDYLRLQAALLADGQAPEWAGGARLLDPETVRAMFVDQTGGIGVPQRIAGANPLSTADFVFPPGSTFGHGLLLTAEDQSRRRRAGTGSWAGIFNTHFWIDPRAGVTGALYSNCLPLLDPRAAGAYVAFERMLYASL